MRQQGVPRGKVTMHVWRDSNAFPGTIRRYWTYVPVQYDANKPAALMVFQDGHAYVSEAGHFRVPIVFDNLIHKGYMPGDDCRADQSGPHEEGNCHASPASGRGRRTAAWNTTSSATPTRSCC